MEGFIILAIIVGFIIINILKSSKKSRSYYKSTYRTPTKGREIETEIIICSNKDCQQKLRLPKSNRKLTVTCPTCNKSFGYLSSSNMQGESTTTSIYNDIKINIIKPKQIKIVKPVSDGFSSIPQYQSISISKIKDSRCPFKYFKNYIEDPREEKPFLSIELGLGQYFHSKVERLFKIIAAQQRLITRQDILDVNSLMNEFEISFLWNKRLRKPYKIIRYDFEYFKNRLKNITNNFNRNVIPRLVNHKVLKTEGSLEIKTDTYAVKGKYDLVTQDHDNRLILWDWKTGAAPKPDFYEDFALQKIQLGIYAIWIRYRYETGNVLANAVFLRDGAYFLKEVFEYHIEKKVIDYIDNEYKYLKSITSYVPIPNNLCQWCSWKSKCQTWT